jgi:hypothetical protein
VVEIYIGNSYTIRTRLVETRLMIELDFYIYVFSMELRSFEKPYVVHSWVYNFSDFRSPGT